MFVMDADTPGVEILRPMQVFGHDDAPHGHMHLRFTNVRLPASAVVLGEGRGFEVAQGPPWTRAHSPLHARNWAG
jgi:acyl-CoA dehydrogenase